MNEVMNEDANLIAQLTITLDDWISAVVLSAQQTVEVGGMRLPPLPNTDLQISFVGQAGSQAMEKAAPIYRLIHSKVAPEISQRPLKILDFGCGWGRMLYFFLRDTPGRNLYGVDPQQIAVRECRKNLPALNIIQTEYKPPLPLRSASFDLVVALSVFSHLPELSSMQWVQELFRVLKPGGMLVLTTHAPELIDDCVCFASDNDGESEQAVNTDWYRNLGRSWFAKQPDQAHRMYRAGEYLYAPTGGAGTGGDYYGDTIIPPAYIQRHWSNFFSLERTIVDRSVYWQSVFVLRRCE